MPSIEVSREQHAYLMALREQLSEQITYGHVRVEDAVQYLIDHHRNDGDVEVEIDAEVDTGDATDAGGTDGSSDDATVRRELDIGDELSGSGMSGDGTSGEGITGRELDIGDELSRSGTSGDGPDAGTPTADDPTGMAPEPGTADDDGGTATGDGAEVTEDGGATGDRGATGNGGATDDGGTTTGGTTAGEEDPDRRVTDQGDDSPSIVESAAALSGGESTTADEEGDDADGSGGSSDDDAGSDGDIVNEMMQLLDAHREKWSESDTSDGKYEVELPDGGVETAMTKDDVRALLFRHYR